MRNKHLIILLVFSAIICSCGISNHRNFNKRKYLKLEELKPEEKESDLAKKQTSVSESETAREEMDENKSKSNDSLSTAVEETTIETNENFCEKSGKSEIVKNKRRTPPQIHEQKSTVDEGDDEYKYEKKSRHYTQASYVLIWTSGIIMLIVLGLILMVLGSGLSGAQLLLLLWLLTFLFIPSMITAGLALHFVRKSIQYDRLDRRETTKKQRIILWLSFFFILASAVPFLVMLNYG